MKRKFFISALVVIIVIASAELIYNLKRHINQSNRYYSLSVWTPPDTNAIPLNDQGNLIRYGRKLITNTSYYYGIQGKISHHTNGLNCGNCHLDAGTKFYGNNFALVASGYPRYKERSGTIETITKKVEDCFERSMNGIAIDSNSTEMRALVAYLNWVGKSVTKNIKISGSGIAELQFMNRLADSAKGRGVYINKCLVCHGNNGGGKYDSAIGSFVFPSLWGNQSYNTGASIYRVSKLAGFIKYNMPLAATYNRPGVTNEEAWDLAAYINSMPHPYKDVLKDWPKLSTKPYDYPFGPYLDKFSEKDHKYGPFAPIKNYYTLVNKR